MAALASNPSTRTPRFRSLPPRQNVALTARDLHMLAAVAHHHFLRAPDIARRIAPGAAPCPSCEGTGQITIGGVSRHHALCVGTGRAGDKRIIERIGEIYAAGYLTRPPAQMDYFVPGGSVRLVYGLSNEGARALMASGTLAWSERVEHSLKNATASKRFIHHTLATAELSLQLVAAVRRAPAINLLETQALIAILPAKTQTRQFPFKLTANLALGATPQPFAVIPDWAFVLEFDHPRTGRRERRGFLAEIDMGSMPIVRTTTHGTSLIKKMLVYATAADADQHKRDFEWQNFRVPIVTTTPARIENIRREMAKSPLLRNSQYFYFTTHDALRQAPDLFALPWIKPSGATTTLLPSAA